MQRYLKDMPVWVKSRSVSPGFTKAFVYSVNSQNDFLLPILPERIKGAKFTMSACHECQQLQYIVFVFWNPQSLAVNHHRNTLITPTKVFCHCTHPWQATHAQCNHYQKETLTNDIVNGCFRGARIELYNVFLITLLLSFEWV